MKKFLKTLAVTLAMAMLMSISALAAPVVNPAEDEAIEFELADTGDKFTFVEYCNDAIVAGGQYMIFVVTEEDGAYLPTANSILYVNQAQADEDGVVTFENVYPKTMQSSGIMISGTGISELLLVAEITVDETEPDYDLGDVDGNGSVDVGDATMLLKVFAGLAGDFVPKAAVADVDGNGAVDIGDATYLLKVFAGLTELN